jgi:spermidine/putrescine transport system substrate-binding protein
MLSTLQFHPDKYDLIVTSGSLIKELIAMRLLSTIDIENISNLKNIEPKFKNPVYEPNLYSVPYLWGTTGIAINRKYIKETEKSWKILWNPLYNRKIAMLNNMDEVIGAALKSLGFSLNTEDIAEIEQARKVLFKQKPFVINYLDPITIRDKLIKGELWAAQIYSGEGMFAVDKNPDLEYIIPKEGTALWVDFFAIPRDAKHKYTAEVFINYVLEPKVSAGIANYLWYANCNQEASQYTDKEILESPSLYPDKEVLKKCQYFIPWALSEDDKEMKILFNKIWAELKAGKKDN